MSVLIRGMEMPPSCRKCCFCDFGKVGYWCDRLEKTLSKWYVRTQRDAECPLEEIPPHGRLIDADALANKTFYNPVSAPYITYRTFIDAPTIIPAERSGE